MENNLIIGVKALKWEVHIQEFMPRGFSFLKSILKDGHRSTVTTNSNILSTQN